MSCRERSRAGATCSLSWAQEPVRPDLEGRNAAGTQLAPRSYWHRVDGRDADGRLRYTDLTLKPATGSVALTK